MEPTTLGVEEEFLVVEAATAALVPRSHELLPAARRRVGDEVTEELNLCQIEVGTPVCRTLGELRSHLARLRSELAAAAEPLGLAVAATGTHPFSPWEHQAIDTRKARYSRMQDEYQIVAHQQVICGCHVHVGIDAELVVDAMRGVRPWLPVLLALSANSPFWAGEDTGYASYRLEVWQHWPTAGMPPDVADQDELDALVEELQRSEAIEDPTFLYWYVRPSVRYPTIELRICDVCIDVDTAVAVASLSRALAWTCARLAVEGRPAGGLSRETLEAATWRAARYGLTEALVSPLSGTTVPAAAVVDELMAYVREALEVHGDREETELLVRRIVLDGNGADRQRRALAAHGSWPAVVDDLLLRPATAPT